MSQKVKKNYLYIIISISASYIITLVLFRFFNLIIPYTEAIFLISMFALAWLIFNSYKIADKPLKIGSAIFAFLLALSFVIGNKIHIFEKPYFDYFKLIDLIYLISIALFLYFAAVSISNLVSKASIKFIPPKGKGSYKYCLLIFAIIVVLWLPYFLIYYPGNLSPDSFSSIYQSIGTYPYNNHHPIVFTLLVQFFIKFGMMFGNLNFAVACFSFTQLIALAGLLSYTVYWLKKKGTPGYILILITLFFSLNPVIAMYSITMWKDVIFAGWILLLMLHLYDVIESNGSLYDSAKGLFVLAVLSIVVSFSRNNGLYIVIAVLVSLAVYFRKYYKRLLPVFLSIILFIAIIQGPIYNLLGINQSNFAESVGLPLQQIAYTLDQNGPTNKQQVEFINNILPVETITEVYKPYSSDYIKFNPSFNNEFLNNNKFEFLKTWLSILPSNFTRYVKAWLMQTTGYYHIGTTSWIVYDRIDATNNGTNDLGIINTDFIQKHMHVNLQPTVRQVINKITTYPIIENLYSIAFMVWVTFFCALAMIIKKRSKYILALVPLIALWGTIMIAAPTYCEFRYMFSFHLALPFIILMLFTKNKGVTQ